MPQDTAHARPSAHSSDDWRRMEVSFQDQGESVATSAMAPFLGGPWRILFRRVAIMTILFVHIYPAVVGIIIALLVFAEVATRVVPLFLSSTQADRDSAITTSNDGNRTRRTSARRQKEVILDHLQRLATAAAAAFEADAAAAANVPPSLHYYQRERVTVEYPEWNGTALTITSLNTSSNSPAAATAPTTARQANSNPVTTLPATWSSSRNSPAAAALTAARRAHNSNPEKAALSETVQAQHPKKHRNPNERPCKSLQGDENSVVIRFQFPVYVCDLVFWNDVHITVPSSSQPSSPPSSAATSAKKHQTTKDGASTSTSSNGGASDVAGLGHQIEMRMWMEMNRDRVAVGSRNDKNSCADCLMGSHSVGKRRFECSYVDWKLDVHKNTFHEGRKFTKLGSRTGLNFRFKTGFEQLPRSGSKAPAFQQQVTFELLTQTSKLDGQTSNYHQQQSSKVDAGSSTNKRQGGKGSGLLAVIKRVTNSQSALAPTAKCCVEAVYTLEDRRLATTDSCGNSQLSWDAPGSQHGNSRLD